MAVDKQSPPPKQHGVRAPEEAILELKAKQHLSHPSLPASEPQEQIRNRVLGFPPVSLEDPEFHVSWRL